MSSLIVEVCKIDRVEKHPNADRMAIAVIKGWRTCVVRDPETGKTQFAEGDNCVYIPPDTMLPVPLADRLNVTKYCSSVKDASGNVLGVRVPVARLRNEPSYGFPMAVEDPTWEVGRDVAAHYGMTKWEPPLDSTDGDSERSHPAFHRYLDLENINNFPDIIQVGEEVVFTEKVHGKNCRVGLVRDTRDGIPVWQFMAGSHDVRRKELQTQRKRCTVRNPDGTLVTEKVFNEHKGIDDVKEVEWFYEVSKRSQFFEALDRPGVRDLLLDLCNGQHDVVVFGEIFGSGVQDMAYGFVSGQWDFRVFDITVDGKYLDVDTKLALCKRHRVATVPELYRGPFSREAVAKYVGGPTTVCDPSRAGFFEEREGIVITTVKERTATTPTKFFERAAVKAINFAYLERKGGTEFH